MRRNQWPASGGIRRPNAKGAIPASDRTLAELLKDAGYDTAIVGKWHLGDEPGALPTRHGFDSWLGTPYSNDQDWLMAHATGPLWHSPVLMQEFEKAVTDDNRHSSDWNTALVRSHRSSAGYADVIVERPANQEVLTKRYTEEAVALIRSHAKGRKPFFLYVAYNMPHVPTFASDAFKGSSLSGAYGDVVQEIDWSVGEIRRALEATSLTKNSILIFASDNGPASVNLGGGSTGPLKGRKGTTFEGGVRSPAVFWWPGHIKPAIVHSIGSLIDLYATSLSLAGVSDIPENIDSIDLTPALVGEPSPRRTLEYFSIRGQLLGYRHGPWKVSFTENGTSLSKNAELYNLEHDPSELRDVSAAYPQVLEGLVNEARVRDATIPRAEPIFDRH